MTSTVPFVNDGAATNGNGSQLPATVSDAIRERLKQAGASFLANDNIADHLQPGDLVRLEQEVADKVRDLLRTLVIDIDNDHNTHETAERVAKMYSRRCSRGATTSSPRWPASPM